MSETDLSNYPRPAPLDASQIPLRNAAIHNLKSSFNFPGIELGGLYVALTFALYTVVTHPAYVVMRDTPKPQSGLVAFGALTLDFVVAIILNTLIMARSIAIVEQSPKLFRRRLSLGNKPAETLSVCVRVYALSQLAGLAFGMLGIPLTKLREHHVIPSRVEGLGLAILLIAGFSIVYSRYCLAPFIAALEDVSASEAIRLSKARTERKRRRVGFFFWVSRLLLDRGYSLYYLPAVFLFEFHARNLAHLYQAIKPAPEESGS